MCISGWVNNVQVELEALNNYCLPMMYFCFQKCGMLVVMIYEIQSLVLSRHRQNSYLTKVDEA